MCDVFPQDVTKYTQSAVEYGLTCQLISPTIDEILVPCWSIHTNGSLKIHQIEKQEHFREHQPLGVSDSYLQSIINA